MTKVFKIIGRTLGIFLEWLIIFVFLFAFLIRTSEFQTYLAQLGTEFLSSELDTKMSIEKLDILFFDRVELKGVHLEDKQKDTLAYVGRLSVRTNELLSWKNAGEPNAVIHLVELNDVWVHLKRGADTSRTGRQWKLHG